MKKVISISHAKKPYQNYPHSTFILSSRILVPNDLALEA